MTRDELIERLAGEPSQQNDARIHAHILGSDWYAKRSEINGEWLCFSRTSFRDQAHKLPDCKSAPPYTSSLDAKVPGENIVWVYLLPGDGWRARHDAGAAVGCMFHGHHPTSEATARRIAGLLAREKA